MDPTSGYELIALSFVVLQGADSASLFCLLFPLRVIGRLYSVTLPLPGHLLYCFISLKHGFFIRDVCFAE